MQSLEELKEVTKKGIAVVKSQPGIIEGLVYASSNSRTVGRIIYTSHIPCNGLEEPKSDEDSGVAVEVWFQKGEKRLLGFGHEPNNLSLEGVKKALKKAVRDGVEDRDFNGFLKPADFPKREGGLGPNYHDKKIMEMSTKKEAELLSKLSWETIEGAVDTIDPFARKHKKLPNDLAFILNGDNFIIRERMALETTGGISDSDETTVILSFLTAMLEKDNSKGSSWSSRLKIGDDFSAYEIGKRAALAAINGIGGVRISSGKYRVVFGHQAVTELFSLLAGHLNLAMVDMGATIFLGRYGQIVASENLTLYDDATLEGGAGSKRITCEGCPTGKTLLIDRGVLTGYLTDWRTSTKVLNNKQGSFQKLGVDPHEIRHALSPNNGFRFARGGGRVASSGIEINATNLVVDSQKPLPPAELIKDVAEGVFIGRLWYTYPVGGYSSGIISGTAVADCYKIRDGKLAEPILPNTIRLEDNLGKMIKNITAVGDNQEQTILWASDEITHAPWVAIDDVNLVSIAENN